MILIVFSAIFAIMLSYQTANRSNDLVEKTLEIQDNLSNYPMQVIAYPIVAMIEGSYVNGSRYLSYSEGFLNATLIVICPHEEEIYSSDEDFTEPKITIYKGCSGND